MTAYMGIDLGGTNARVALVKDAGVVENIHFATNLERGGDDLVGRLARAVNELKDVDTKGVGLACPGNLDRGAGVVSFSPNLRQLNGYPLAHNLSLACGLPVALENDANCYALGEHDFGPNGQRDLALFTLGTGVGGGLMLGGQLVLGPLGIGGELGHMLVEPGGRMCGCGALGCLEAYASATALTGMLAEGLAQQRPTCLAAGSGAKDIARAAGGGDALAGEIMARAGMALGRAFAEVAVFTGCDYMVIGGGVAPAWPLMEPAAKEALKERLHIADPGDIIITLASLGGDAPLLGAAALARRRFGGAG